MTLIYLDEDPWLQELNNCERLCGELAVRISNVRSNEGVASDIADIRICLRQCDQQLVQLRSNLLSYNDQLNITPEEKERRERCLEKLMDRLKHLRSDFISPKTNSSGTVDPNRDELFAGKSNYKQDRLLNIGDSDVEQSRAIQAEIIAEQDRGLEELAKVISRQKHIAQSIDTEVNSQTQIISDLTESVTNVGTRTQAATNRTANIITTDNTCGYWMVIFLLLGAILVVLIL